ncbi:hypothetical protein CMI42_01020 [Candidatus Pacearchaeota archaeon]|nr:hypothetical protein [Candidatus Pacearchaeota archaeon]|tara:strand:- start:143 stop:610 length:468 start_codon:yes stop_codon:yes gene_type:complete
MEKYQQHLQDAIKSLKLADHMTYVTFPLINEYRLLLKIFDEIYKSVINNVNAVLCYEYLYKRIRLYDNSEDNLQTFSDRCAKNYSLSNEQIKKILEIIDLNKKHKKSAMEFVKKEKVVIMSEGLGVKTIDLYLIKEYLLVAKEFLVCVSKKVADK